MKFLTNEKLTIVGAAGMIGSNMVQTAIMMGLNQSCVHLIPEVASTRSIRNLSVIAAAETIQPK